MVIPAPVRRRHYLVAFFALVLAAAPVHSWNLNTPQSTQTQTKGQTQKQDDPLQRPLPKCKRGADDFQKRFLDDVRAIITPEEEQAFKRLSTEAEREQYIFIFWQHRDPTPDTEENEYRDEYYRRLAYVDEHFSAGIRGRNTDRGLIYLLHGPPDSIESHPAGGPYQRTAEEGGGETQTYPFERWRYRHIEGVGSEIELEFVDTCSCGAYELTIDPNKKDALGNVPNAGLNFAEQSGLSTKADRLSGRGTALFGANSQSRVFDQIEMVSRVTAPPPVKFKDLEAVVTSKVRYNFLPFDVQVDFVKANADTVLVPITIQLANRDLTYVAKDGVQRASVNIFGRISTLTGHVTQTFEEPLRMDVPADQLNRFAGNVSVYQKSLPLRPGLYRLSIALKDVNGDKLGSIQQRILVPDFSADKLASSSLIVADVMEMAPATEIGTGSFIINAERVRPRVATSGRPAAFKRNQKVNLWMQVYNLALDEQTKKPAATVVYEIRDAATNKPVMYVTETADHLASRGDQVTLQKSLQPNQLDPGVYEVTIKVNDTISKQTIAPTAKFSVE
ncbi:MAG TPA: GWxTD domain-containing protein [Candidatus Angelobacter sp.]|nr:GWxTD domain-containing protein [Candidatus Angelobacter sp.]